MGLLKTIAFHSFALDTIVRNDDTVRVNSLDSIDFAEG